MSGRSTLRFLYSASLVALTPLGGQVALAQAPADPASAPAADSDAAPGGDIIVTAQRRDERLVDVPVAVSTFSEAQLTKTQVNAVDDLVKLSPGVIMNRNGNSLQPTIRGIGTSATAGGSEANVAIYLDGVYLPDMVGNIFDLANVKQVQILKGPQGTLFGRNATAGAILITTRDPSLTPEAAITLGYGSFNEIKASGYASLPLSDTLAVSVSGYSRYMEGFQHDLRTNATVGEAYSRNFRAKLMWKPSDSAKIILGASYEKTSDPAGLNQNTLNGNSIGNKVNPQPIATDPRQVSFNFPTVIRSKAKQIDLHTTFDLGFATLSTVSALRDQKSAVANDSDSSYNDVQSVFLNPFFKSHSEELTLTSNGKSALNWTLGAYYFDGDAGVRRFILNRGAPFDGLIQTKAYAAFGDATYELGNLSLIAGLRYSNEKKSFQRVVSNTGAVALSAEQTFSNLSPRLGVKYAIGPRANVYATWSRGFKSGTYNTSTASTLPVKPENVDAFEVGLKTSSQVFSVNTSAFYYNYRNIQIQALQAVGGTSVLTNAAKSEIYGFDADILWRPTSNIDISPKVAYTHAKFISFPLAPVFDPIVGTNGLLVGNASGSYVADNTPMQRAPLWTLSADLAYRVPVGDGQVEFSLRPYWTSSIRYSADGRVFQPAYATLDASVTWTVSDALSLSIWGKNITDTTYASWRSTSSGRDGIIWAPPATVGGTLSYRFGR